MAQGLQAIIGILKGTRIKSKQSLRYDTALWDADRAKAHCKRKEGRFEQASQKNITNNMKNQKQYFEAYTEVKDGQMVAIASDESVDRVGDSLKVAQWDLRNFKRNPVLLAGHDYKPQSTIGRAENIRVDGKKLIFEPVFHGITQLSREVEEMFKKGFLNAWSVGFIPGSDEKGAMNELLEISAVPVPANPKALVIQRSYEEAESQVKEEEVNQIQDWIQKGLESMNIPDTLEYMPERKEDPRDAKIKSLEDEVATLQAKVKTLEAKSGEGKPSKGRDPKAARKPDQVMVRALQVIAKESSTLLRDIKRQKENQ